MKLSSLESLWLYFVIALSCLNRGDGVEPVLDDTGRKLSNTSPYYILQILNANGKDVSGGAFAKGDDPYPSCKAEECTTFTVEKISNRSEFGLPVIFDMNNDAVLLVSADFNISTYYSFFSDSYTDPMWRLAFDKASKKQYVTNGADCCATPQSFPRSWFRVEKIRNNFVLRCCYSGCDRCKTACRNLGFSDVRGRKVLTFGSVPFKVAFTKMVE